MIVVQFLGDDVSISAVLRTQAEAERAEAYRDGEDCSHAKHWADSRPRRISEEAEQRNSSEESRQLQEALAGAELSGAGAARQRKRRSMEKGSKGRGPCKIM